MIFNCFSIWDQWLSSIVGDRGFSSRHQRGHWRFKIFAFNFFKENFFLYCSVGGEPFLEILESQLLC